MENNVDRRVKKTKSALKDAYINLVEQYSEKEITVSMVTQNADVNRATFYLHYSNKAEFLEEILYDVLEGLKESILFPFQNEQKINVNKLTPTTERIFQYIENNNRIFYALNIGHTHFKKELELLFYTIFSKEISIETNPSFGDLNYDIFLHYQTNATLGLILYWIESKFHYSASYMMDQLTIISNTQIVNLNKNIH
ncbi:TetR/AcrR family transcriptional regulator [Oceanobacillus sp. 1P07AA]|uniref:TetR/AcrR family transcriptional regulator n=1 Tax=Oceanobacillus sp. 1P07AA TaxID=3132293 RepID=UPI0039A5CDF9